MIIGISTGAEADIADGFWFYGRRASVWATIFAHAFLLMSNLRLFIAGIHEVENGFHRSLGKRFPFGIYYTVENEHVTVVAILDLRREPLWIRESLDSRK